MSKINKVVTALKYSPQDITPPRPQAEHARLPWETGNNDKWVYVEGQQNPIAMLENAEDARLIVASVNHAEALAEALRNSADKLNDLSEWLKAYAEPKQALSVKAIESEAHEALANWEGAKHE